MTENSFYFDTSALVKLFVPEAESDNLLLWRSKKRIQVWITDLQELEYTNAIYRRVFNNQLSKDDSTRCMSEFGQELKSNGLVKRLVVWPEAFHRAISLSEQLTESIGVRSLDLLHLGIAQQLKATYFVSFDKRQTTTAKKVGFKTLTF